jgi:hypothetical protein
LTVDNIVENTTTRLNAVTGKEDCPADSQDYLVCPPEWWFTGVPNGPESAELTQIVAPPFPSAQVKARVPILTLKATPKVIHILYLLRSL